jgi:hypothetical protein
MAIWCSVFRPGQGSPETYKFVTLPRVGEGITLPGHHDDFTVESIEHMARQEGDKDDPTVQMHLRSELKRKLRRA